MTHAGTEVGTPPARSLYGDELAAGAMCGEYVVEGLLGRGGCSRVYRARHRLLRRAAAVKVLAFDLALSSHSYQRFVFEAQVANRIRHRGIVDVHDFGRLPDGRPFFAMEALDGRTIEQRLATSGPLPARAALAVGQELADALTAVHAAGIVHRDVKPGNVFLHGPTEVVKLMDFGIAKLVRPAPGEPHLTTGAATRVGTPEAMAPEQIRGEPVDARTDVYGLGVLLFRMLTGRWPFESDDPLAIERMQLDARPPPASRFAAVPPEVDAVIARCLAKTSHERFPTAAAAIETLERGLADAGPDPTAG